MKVTAKIEDCEITVSDDGSVEPVGLVAMIGGCVASLRCPSCVLSDQVRKR